MSAGLSETVRVLADGNGNVFAAGNVGGERFVSFNGNIHPGLDAIVARLDAEGRVVWRTVLGGSDGDRLTAAAIDAQGNIYVAGNTCSPDFPLVNPFQREFPPHSRENCQILAGFVAKLDSSGKILYATFLGGSTTTTISAIAADSSGSAYVTGHTVADDFPTTTGSLLPAVSRDGFSGTNYAFLTRFSQAGSRLLYSTYLGGARAACTGGSGCIGVVGITAGTAIAVDSQGNAFVAGVTSAIDFPVSPDAIQTSCKCYRHVGDGFVAKLDSAGAKILYATYFGGSFYNGLTATLGTDEPRAISLDRSGHAYVAGVTSSVDFPVTSGALQTEFQPVFGPGNLSLRRPTGFVFKLDRDGRDLAYSTFLGGSTAEVNGLAVDEDGSAWVTGRGAGPDFPVTADAYPRGGDFLLTLNPSGRALSVSTLLPSGVAGTGIALHQHGGVVLAGGESGLISRIRLEPNTSPAILGVGSAAGTPVTARVAPGELISIYGLNMGSAGAPGARVFINGIAAPLLHAGTDQINAIVPFDVAGWRQTILELVQQDSVTAHSPVDVIGAEPEVLKTSDGLFAILNRDGSLNTRENPAALGSDVSIFATGIGDMVPRPSDGEITGDIPARPVLPVSVRIGNQAAEVLEAVAARGLAAGVVQITVRLPARTEVFLSLPVVLGAGAHMSRRAATVHAR